jgi:hypothetical protein
MPTITVSSGVTSTVSSSVFFTSNFVVLNGG